MVAPTVACGIQPDICRKVLVDSDHENDFGAGAHGVLWVVPILFIIRARGGKREAILAESNQSR